MVSVLQLEEGKDQERGTERGTLGGQRGAARGLVWPGQCPRDPLSSHDASDHQGSRPGACVLGRAWCLEPGDRVRTRALHLTPSSFVTIAGAIVITQGHSDRKSASPEVGSSIPASGVSSSSRSWVRGLPGSAVPKATGSPQAVKGVASQPQRLPENSVPGDRAGGSREKSPWGVSILSPMDGVRGLCRPPEDTEAELSPRGTGEARRQAQRLA